MAGLGEFLAMGGYAAFVWPAYGLSALVLGGLVVASIRRARALAREVAALEAVSPRRARRKS